MTRTGSSVEPAVERQSHDLGCYVYGVVEAATALPRGLAGLDGSAVRIINCGLVAAVVGDVSIERPAGHRKDLVAHQQVLDSLATSTVVVPVRFGSILPDERSVVEDFLLPEETRFAGYLEALAGRSQLSLRATYHPDTALAEIVQADPEIAELRRLTRDLPEDSGYSSRVRLGELVARALEDKRTYDAQVLLDAVLPYVVAHSVRGGGGVDHIVDVALLVDDDRRDELEQQLEWLAEAVHERMRLRLLGPMAAYDFAEGF